MLKRAVFERSRRELSLDVSIGVHILLVVEQSSLESQSRGCVCQDTDTYGTAILFLPFCLWRLRRGVPYEHSSTYCTATLSTTQCHLPGTIVTLQRCLSRL